MVNKRRAKKIKAPYKKYVGKGLEGDTAADLDLEDLSLEPDQPDQPLEEPSQELIFGKDQQQQAHPGLPADVLNIVFSYCEEFYNFLFVNSYWYMVALAFVYRRPELGPQNFGQFVQAITDHKQLGSYVRELDLTGIVQTGKNSMTARLLRRCASRLELFVAPQSHFGVSPLMSLRNCTRLRVLDLGLVSETVNLPQLFTAIEEFQDLEVMQFPRSSISCDHYNLKWPPNLRSLGLAGGISSEFLEQTKFPDSITTLQLSNCPLVSTDAVLNLLTRVGPHLKRLVVQYPLPLVAATALDTALFLCPNLTSFVVSVDYVSADFLDSVYTDHPLRTLTLTSSGMIGHTDKIKPTDVIMVTDSLNQLSRVRVSIQMGWNPRNETIAELASILDERGGGLWFI